MWNYLRAFRPFGARFRRQAPIGPIIVDFAWLSARLVIEVDGGSHGLPGHAEPDRERDAYLKAQGFEVIRIRGSGVSGNTSESFARIEDAGRPYLRTQIVNAGASVKTPPLAPPHKGEGDLVVPSGEDRA